MDKLTSLLNFGETCKQLVNHPAYFITSEGRIYDCKKDRFISDGKKISIQLDGVKEQIHLLVLRTFVSEKPHGFLGCHKNGINTDNRLSNLYWGRPIKRKAFMRKDSGKSRSGRKI